MKRRQLRSGYTTGACAAASAKAAAKLLIKKLNCLSDCSNQKSPDSLEIITITLPEGEKASFKINKTSLINNESVIIAAASTIKFAGDDPDVTNGAEIIAEIAVKLDDCDSSNLYSNRPMVIPHQTQSHSVINIKGGSGVGIVTKLGLSVSVGSPAINPVPQKMIRDAVIEAFKENGHSTLQPSELTVTISVTDGEKLARKTLNPRLGITGGISILGTTGIVKPLSSEAWTATISTSMDVATAAGCREIVLSAGRASEKAHMKKYKLPEESYVMMGDYLEFSLREAKKHGFERIHLCAQWAKMLKIAMSTPQTHVRYGAIDIKKAVRFLNQAGISFSEEIEFNTAREIFQTINSIFHAPAEIFCEVCRHAQKYSEMISGEIPVVCHLISYEGEIKISSGVRLDY